MVEALAADMQVVETTTKPRAAELEAAQLVQMAATSGGVVAMEETVEMEPIITSKPILICSLALVVVVRPVVAQGMAEMVNQGLETVDQSPAKTVPLVLQTEAVVAVVALLVLSLHQPEMVPLVVQV
jgi:hypothetical protein